MTIDIVDGIRTLQLDMIATVALAGLLLLLGYAVRSKAIILEKMAIPAPVIGGVICALVIWLLRDTGWAQVKMDTTLQLPFMLAFFTCIGFGGSFAILRKGGRYLIVFLAAMLGAVHYSRGCWRWVGFDAEHSSCIRRYGGTGVARWGTWERGSIWAYRREYWRGGCHNRCDCFCHLWAGSRQFDWWTGRGLFNP